MNFDQFDELIAAMCDKSSSKKIDFRTIIPGLLLLCLSFVQICPAAAQLNRTPYRFDAGATTSQVAAGAVLLTPDDAYKPERGFGWLHAPEAAFLREDLKRSRDAFTIDGVVGRDLLFQADLPSGAWWLTLWLDAGLEDSSTVQLLIGDAPIKPHWHAFRPPAEPRSRLQAIYRVYSGPVPVAGNGVRLELKAVGDSVRLLGMRLMPAPGIETPTQKAMLQVLRAAGRYNSTASLDSIMSQLRKMADEKENKNFVTYWLEQVALLREAELHYEKRGWEWAREQSGLSIFDRFHQAVMILDALLDHPDPEKDPLYERALWYRGRLLYWLGLERGGPNEISEGREDLAKLFVRYPDDTLLAMYNGERIDLPDPCDNLVQTAGAPKWSQLQREALCRLRNIVHWWVNAGQAPNGEFGGKLGDDVELLRDWMPLMLVGDTLAFQGWKKLADAVWESPKVLNGYSKRPLDVEHSSEYISDTAPVIAVFADAQTYTERLRYSADYFRNLWTAKSDSGRRFFRSAWFSSTEVLTEPPKNRDLDYNGRAVKAVRYLAWKTGDPGVVQALAEWSRAWLSAAMRVDKGKPRGIIPASVRFPDEAINGDERSWYKANMYWDYFDWPHLAGSFILDQLLFTYSLTDDPELLQPLLATFDLISKYDGTDANDNADPPEPGSEAWAVHVLKHHQGFWSVAGQWRLLTADSTYDALLLRYGTPYIRYKLTGDEQYLLDGLNRTLKAIRYNTPLLTSEVLHTDRVYIPGSEHLKVMLSGDGTSESLSPFFAISWEDADENFTALVTDTRSDRLAVQVFSHAVVERRVRARLWRLAPGDYKLTFANKTGVYSSTTLRIKERGQRIAIRLPARELTTMQLERQ